MFAENLLYPSAIFLDAKAEGDFLQGKRAIGKLPLITWVGHWGGRSSAQISDELFVSSALRRVQMIHEAINHRGLRADSAIETLPLLLRTFDDRSRVVGAVESVAIAIEEMEPRKVHMHQKISKALGHSPSGTQSFARSPAPEASSGGEGVLPVVNLPPTLARNSGFIPDPTDGSCRVANVVRRGWSGLRNRSRFPAKLAATSRPSAGRNCPSTFSLAIAS